MYYDADGTAVLSNGDKVRKVSLGLSNQVGSRYDNDLFKYKGAEGTASTSGFHLSVNASTISGTTYVTTPYDLEGQPVGDKLTDIRYRKFTFAAGGGFDGWDIYRNVRTYGDGYIYGKPTYVANNVNNGGVFDANNGNSDYYSYLQGIRTFENPEAVDINVFATPGINFYDHSSLVNQAIEMVEEDRADSLYIMNSPNFTGAEGVEEVVAAIDDSAIDSNYSATYWPWIQVRDTDNATQLYIPPTGEVVRNIALTDNVSYPWFAVAGYSRGLVRSIKANKKLTLDERDTLYSNRVNPIATFSDTGTIIWGNKTLQLRESALDRINVRRLLLRARKLISAVSVRLLFEQNDEQVRQEFLRLVNPILESIKKERGLYDFRVRVSNDPEDLDSNTLRGKIYLKPTRALEFIEIEFNITPTGASFENI
jgi:phage tail sheath protein FI